MVPFQVLCALILIVTEKATGLYHYPFFSFKRHLFSTLFDMHVIYLYNESVKPSERIHYMPPIAGDPEHVRFVKLQ